MSSIELKMAKSIRVEVSRGLVVKEGPMAEVVVFGAPIAVGAVQGALCFRPGLRLLDRLNLRKIKEPV